jgi:hypothetical protein
MCELEDHLVYQLIIADVHEYACFRAEGGDRCSPLRLGALLGKQ